MDDLRREIERTVEELAYAAVGFAVLGFQRAQVTRRKVERCAPAWAGQIRDLVSSATGNGEDTSDEDR